MKTVLAVAQLLLITNLCGESVAAQDLYKLNHFIQTQTASPAATAFRESRDLIKEGEWQKAEARFNRFITEFPKDREVPAALYWLAFALKQENKFPAADAALTKLIAEHPSSQWLDDARALRVEIAPRLKNGQLIEQGVTETNEEIRLAALQSLFEASPERALALASDILKPGAGGSRLMKEGALSMLADSESREAIPVLAQVARQDGDLRLQKKAIEALGDIELPGALTALSDLAHTSSNIEIRRRAIEELADHDDDSAALAHLIQLYDVEQDERLKETIMEALGDSEEKPALQKLMQIATSDASLKLRKRAVNLIAKSKDPGALKFLEQLLKKN